MGSLSIDHLQVLLILGAIYVPLVFYILALRKALAAIDPAMRSVTPGLSWLLLIPVFQLIWIFFLVVSVSRDYEKMWLAGRLSAQTTTGFGVGIAYGVCTALCLVPGPNLLMWIPALVFWILHWVKVNEARGLVISL